MGPNVIALVFGVLTVGVIVSMLRHRQMREKYATSWAIVAGGVLVLAIFPDLLGWAATLVGVAVPLNLLYFVGGLALLIICVQFSVELSSLEEKTRTLAEELALLRAEVDRALGGAAAASPAPPARPSGGGEPAEAPGDGGV